MKNLHMAVYEHFRTDIGIAQAHYAQAEASWAFIVDEGEEWMVPYAEEAHDEVCFGVDTGDFDEVEAGHARFGRLIDRIMESKLALA